MPNDQMWVDAAIEQARLTTPKIPDAILDTFRGLMKSRLSERALTAKEFANVATQLIEGMVETSRKRDDTR